MREIVLDLETTGLDHRTDRIIQIGVVELIDYSLRREKEWYLYPQRLVEDTESFQIHGLSDAFLRDKPLFSQVVEEFLEFIQDSALVIHNAPFDTRFLNFELSRLGLKEIPADRVIDTLSLALRKFPRSKCTLEALGRRLGIKVDGRLHNALVDARVLAECYIALRGGPQITFSLPTQVSPIKIEEKLDYTPRVIHPSEEETKAHEALMRKINNPLWKRDA